MDDDVLVRVENVSKRFCRSLKRSLWYGLQDLGSELGGHRHGGGKGLPQSSADVQLRPDEFWAVKDVSFELRRGECLGLIGRNGAGKTTLLRMLNGLIKPDTGRIELRGRVGAQIALGAGFNPILTGRENIIISSSVLGLTKNEADQRVEEIIDFAEIGEHIDTPVQSYSSGMQVRLGFAIAATLETSILLVDEVLAVGDGRFKVKCANRIRDTMREKSVILVSHSMENISQLCTSVLVMGHGHSLYLGQATEGIAKYNLISQEPESHDRQDCVFSIAPICDLKLSHPDVAADDKQATFNLSFVSKCSFTNIDARLFFWNEELKPVLELVRGSTFCQPEIKEGLNEVTFQISHLPLTTGSYTLDIQVRDANQKGTIIIRYRTGAPFLVMAASRSYAPVHIYV